MFVHKIIFKLLPWVLLLVLTLFLLVKNRSSDSARQVAIRHQTILREVEELGRLELVKYQMKDIIEINQLSKRYLDLGIFRIQKGTDTKAVMIASGEAVACIDLLKLTSKDISGEDTVFVNLPPPELCYYKIDHQNSRLYDLQKGSLMSSQDFNKFIDTAYKEAEAQMMRAALDAGILQEAESMAYKMLEPLLQRIAGKPVVLLFEKDNFSLDDPK